jgi:CBS domain-containing protein
MKDVKARDIMAKRVHSVSPDLPLIDLERELAAHRISGAPVVEGGNVVGIVSRSDIDRHLAREETRSAAAATYFYRAGFEETDDQESAVDPSGEALESMRKTLVREIMTPEVISVAGDDSIGAVAELMRSRRIHRVLVIEGGDLLGLVSSLDVVGTVADRAAR